MYEIILTLRFRKEFKKLERRIQERVRKILKKLEEKPLGSPLKWELKGFYSIHFENNHYRLIYFKEDRILKVMALHVGKRTNDFYKKFRKEVLKQKKVGRL